MLSSRTLIQCFIRTGLLERVPNAPHGKSSKLFSWHWRHSRVIFSGFKALWYTDNKNVESIILSGSRKADFHQLALLVFKVCLKLCMSLEVKWIARDFNTKPDAISKLIDYDDYTINDAIFKELTIFGGPILLTDFLLSQDWRQDNNWICPPVCLLIRVLKHRELTELCKARDAVILPSWKPSYFWTLFCRDGVHWNSFVIGWVFLPKFPGLFIRGEVRNSLFGFRPLDFGIKAP